MSPLICDLLLLFPIHIKSNAAACDMRHAQGRSTSGFKNRRMVLLLCLDGTPMMGLIQVKMGSYTGGKISQAKKSESSLLHIASNAKGSAMGGYPETSQAR
jgi:hypothetical protein